MADARKLDGLWELSWTVDPKPPELTMMFQDAALLMRNGRFVGIDEGGTIYFGNATLPEDSVLRVHAVIDPKFGDPDLYILNDTGQPSKSAVVYALDFALSAADGRQRALGEVSMGPYRYSARLTRMGDLP